jgi:serine/threonine-protein kinase
MEPEGVEDSGHGGDEMPYSISAFQEVLGDRYNVEREIGRGGMAIVYLAEDRKHRRHVAIKMLRPELGAVIGTQRFNREIGIAARLAHPNIVPLLDSGEAGGLLYYVMPFVDGESLRDRMTREGQLPLDDAVNITRDIAGALTYSHTIGLVHRDIKPENILLADGRTLVADFGIARAINAAGNEQLTRTGLTLGTPAYMSPEQATAGKVDSRSDIYSLGCVLYEMLAGTPPFTGENARAIIARKMVDTLPSVRVVRETVSPAIEDVISKALARSPADRFATASELSSALTKALSAPMTDRKAHLRRQRATAVGLLVIIMLAATAWLAKSRGVWFAEPHIESLAVLPFANLSRDTTQDYLTAGMQDALITELAQIGSVRVISRTSTLRFRDTQQAAGEIAGQLDVDALVEASMLKFGDSIRVQLQLIRARPREAHVWARTYVLDSRGVFGLQREMAREIGDQINVRIGSSEEVRVADRRDVDPLAYEEYLRGRHLMQQNTLASVNKAMAHFEAAKQRDPNYAPIYRMISAVWSQRASLGAMSPEDAFHQAEPAIERGLALDSTSTAARMQLAQIHLFQWDWQGADREYRRALAASPNETGYLGAYAVFLAALDDPQRALPFAEKAVRLDPLNPSTHIGLGTVLRALRRFDEAAAHDRAALRIAPKSALAYWALWQIFNEKGQPDSALAALKGFYRASGDTVVLAVLQRAKMPGGFRATLKEAADVLAERSKTHYVKPFWPAALYAYAGETELALDWVEREVDARESEVRNLRWWPGAEKFRTHPRYQALLRHTKLDVGLAH